MIFWYVLLCETTNITVYFSAVSIGTDMLELDVHLTKDEQVVVNHDAKLHRTTDLQSVISGGCGTINRNGGCRVCMGQVGVESVRKTCECNRVWIFSNGN